MSSKQVFHSALVSPSTDQAKETGGATARVVLLSWLALVVALLVSFPVYFAYASAPVGEAGMEVPFYKFASQDFAWLAAAVCLVPVIWRWRWRSMERFAAPERPVSGRAAAVWALGLGAGVLGCVLAGRHLFYHDFAVSMDEFMYRFQLTILAENQLLAPVSDAWFALSTAVRPGFLITDQEYQFWAPGYRPGTAMLGAVFDRVLSEAVMVPVLCAGSVLLVAHLARREMPDIPAAAIWGAALFALSPQFLVTGMSPYTMNAHLFASLLWMALFVQDRPVAHLGAVLVGAWALGLHHVHVHSFFALPFLLNLAIVQRRVGLTAVYAAVYAGAVLVWVFWMEIAILLQGLAPAPKTSGPVSVDGGVGFVQQAVSQGIAKHGAKDLLYWAVNAARFLAWQNLALLPLVLVGLLSWRRMPRNLRLAGWAVLTSLIPYVILMPSQGHGWGYRYLHHVLGGLALIGAFGAAVLIRQGSAWAKRLLGFAATLCLVTLIAAMPLRFWQVERFVGPWARAMDHIRNLPADVVLVDTEDIWYGNDLVRNDPFMRNSPVVMGLRFLPDRVLAGICAENRVETVDAARLGQFRVIRQGRSAEERVDKTRARDARLRAAGCVE